MILRSFGVVLEPILVVGAQGVALELEVSYGGITGAPKP